MKGKSFNISILLVHRQQKVRKKKKNKCTQDNAKTQCKSQKMTIIMEDLNTKVGKDKNGEVFGKLSITDKADMYSRIREQTEQKICSSTRCMKKQRTGH